jgi:hypothetical protein
MLRAQLAREFGRCLNSGLTKQLSICLLILLPALFSGCGSVDKATPTTSTASAATSQTKSSLVLTNYTSSQLGSHVPAYKVTSTNPATKFFQYGIGGEPAATATLYSIGSTISIDPLLLSDGPKKLYFRGTDQINNEASTIFTRSISLFPLIADGKYVGDRLITYGANSKVARRFGYTGTRVNNNVPNGILELFDNDLPSLPTTSRTLDIFSASPISASLINSKIGVLDFSFGQPSTDYIRASGGYGTDGLGGYFDHMIMSYSGIDPSLGTISSTSDLRLYKVRQDIESTKGLLNATGNLKNRATGDIYGFSLILQTYDNFKFTGHLRLISGPTVSTYAAVGKAGSTDGSSNGISFISADNQFSGFLTFDHPFNVNYPDPAQLTISQMAIYSSNILSGAPLDSYYTGTELSVSLAQPTKFNSWPPPPPPQ